jgi:hypothetical protein
VSGTVFKFVYDSTEAYEPLRDAFPFDLLQTAAARNGFPGAHWETGLTHEEAKDLIKREIDSGRPLISPFLKPDAYHGLNIITGYDYEEGVLLIQGAFGTRRSATVPLPEAWDGPTVSPAGWATNPLFVMGEAFDDTSDARSVYTGLVEEAIALLKGGRLEYGNHEGEWQYMRRPGPHRAWYGLPAYEVLAADIANGELVVDRGTGRGLDFGLIWRLDAMVGLLEHDRKHGSQFASLFRAQLPERQSWLAFELLKNLERTAEDAAELRDLFWHKMPADVTEPDDVLEYLDGSDAMVFAIPERAGLADGLRSRGREVYETVWGKVVVEDSPKRRLEAKLKTVSILSRERESLRLLERIAEQLSSRYDMEWPARKRIRPPRDRDGIIERD